MRRLRHDQPLCRFLLSRNPALLPRPRDPLRERPLLEHPCDSPYRYCALIDQRAGRATVSSTTLTPLWFRKAAWTAPNRSRKASGVASVPLAASIASAISRTASGFPAALRASRAARNTVPRLNHRLGLRRRIEMPRTL